MHGFRNGTTEVTVRRCAVDRQWAGYTLCEDSDVGDAYGYGSMVEFMYISHPKPRSLCVRSGVLVLGLRLPFLEGRPIHARRLSRPPSSMRWEARSCCTKRAKTYITKTSDFVENREIKRWPTCALIGAPASMTMHQITLELPRAKRRSSEAELPSAPSVQQRTDHASDS